MRVSLRTRVLAATLALVGVGLSVAGFATYGFLRSLLVHRLDQQLDTAIGPAGSAVSDTIRFGHPDTNGAESNFVPPGTYCALLDPSGNFLIQPFLFGYTDAPIPRLSLPHGLPGSSSSRSDQRTKFTASSAGSSSPAYRLVAVPTSGPSGTLLVGIPLTEITGTLHRLVLVELGVAGAVLVAVGALGWWAVRVGLRPLDRMGETAGAIAAGDLS